MTKVQKEALVVAVVRTVNKLVYCTPLSTSNGYPEKVANSKVANFSIQVAAVGPYIRIAVLDTESTAYILVATINVLNGCPWLAEGTVSPNILEAIVELDEIIRLLNCWREALLHVAAM